MRMLELDGQTLNRQAGHPEWSLEQTQDRSGSIEENLRLQEFSQEHLIIHRITSVLSVNSHLLQLSLRQLVVAFPSFPAKEDLLV